MPHIQDHDSAKGLEPHWGYADRVVPCVNDQGTCEYLDAVYHMHDLSMLYTFILWAVIGAILLTCLFARIVWRREEWRVGVALEKDLETSHSKTQQSPIHRLVMAILATLRHYLLPESFPTLFGHVSRVQVVILAAILIYLLIFSLAGITYKTWVTSVTKSPGKFNTRTGLGGVSDRVGALAYALTPLSILLSSRESALSLLTGIPHTSFLFLHIWTGRIIFVQSFLHTLGWTIIEARLYQPQPTVYRDFMAQLYIVFGVVAMILVTVLYLFSLKRVVYWTGYQVFKLTHYITAILYLAACWIHWAPLACWMIASIILLVLDRGIRLARLALIHTGHLDKAQLLGFKKAQASIKLFTDADGAQVVRMEFEHTHGPWRPGQHFFLTFPGLAWWCAHPFTPALNARPHPQGQRHVYVVRVKEGITRKLAQVAIVGGGEGSTDVLLTGPYGVGFERRSRNMLGIAGGTGISFVFPIFLERLAARHGDGDDALIRLVWIVRKESDVQWFRHEIEKLKPTLANRKKKSSLDVSVMIIITRDRKPQTTRSSNDAIHITHTSEKNPEDLPLPPPAQDTHIEYLYLADHHPSPCALLDEFASSCSNGGSIDVVASGPSAMGRELKAAVARMNCGGKVWRGDRSASVRFVGDVREV